MFIIGKFIEELEQTINLLIIDDLISAKNSIIGMKEKYANEDFGVLAEKYSDLIILYYNLCEFLLNISSNEFDVVSKDKIIDTYKSDDVKNLLITYSSHANRTI